MGVGDANGLVLGSKGGLDHWLFVINQQLSVVRQICAIDGCQKKQASKE